KALLEVRLPASQTRLIAGWSVRTQAVRAQKGSAVTRDSTVITHPGASGGIRLSRRDRAKTEIAFSFESILEDPDSLSIIGPGLGVVGGADHPFGSGDSRSEERRVGKECGVGWTGVCG